MFDKGLWTITPDQRIAVATAVFAQWGSETNWLKHRQDRTLVFHDSSRLRPDPRLFSRHRDHVLNRA